MNAAGNFTRLDPITLARGRKLPFCRTRRSVALLVADAVVAPDRQDTASAGSNSYESELEAAANSVADAICAAFSGPAPIAAVETGRSAPNGPKALLRRIAAGLWHALGEASRGAGANDQSIGLVVIGRPGRDECVVSIYGSTSEPGAARPARVDDGYFSVSTSSAPRSPR
ncbi:MAG TPA: hypothetical protein VN802_20955 [Stellaceae bacterium]|nr:hypothetical protein [Stellaceae bacterium]